MSTEKNLAEVRTRILAEVRAVSKVKWPEINGGEELISYPRETVREFARAGFAEGADWALETVLEILSEFDTLEQAWDDGHRAGYDYVRDLVAAREDPRVPHPVNPYEEENR